MYLFGCQSNISKTSFPLISIKQLYNFVINNWRWGRGGNWIFYRPWPMVACMSEQGLISNQFTEINFTENA